MTASRNTIATFNKQKIPPAGANNASYEWDFLSIDGLRHLMVSVALTANGNRIRHDILRQGHTRHAGVTDVVDIRTDHLAHQRDLTDCGDVRAFLRSADSGQRQFAVAVYHFDQIMRVILRDAGHGTGCGQQNDIRTSGP